VGQSKERATMSGTPIDSTKRGRKAYVKPAVKQVHLKPKEAVLGFCKVSGGGGPNIGGSCNTPGNCSALGS
jgi:hypothetical protein